MEMDSCHLVDGTLLLLAIFPTVWEWEETKIDL
jgi:hypothetical protein